MLVPHDWTTSIYECMHASRLIFTFLDEDYNFNLLLGYHLKKKRFQPVELNNILLTQLKVSDGGDRHEPHHHMFSGTLVHARKKTKKMLNLLAYLLDRWTRVPGVRDCNTLINEVFRGHHEVQKVVQEMIQFL